MVAESEKIQKGSACSGDLELSAEANLFPLAFSEVQKWGVNTHSFLSLYESVQHYRIDNVSGYIPITESPHLILVAGAPVAPDESLSALVTGLMKVATAKRKTLVMLPSLGTHKVLFEQLGFDSVYIGKEPMFSLESLPKPSKSIRQAVNRVQKLGIRIVEYDESFNDAVQALALRWQGTRELPALQFLFQLQPLHLKDHKKLFLAVDPQGKLVAFLCCSPIFGRNGWYLEDLIRDPAAPNGTSELLLTTAFETLAMEGFAVASLAIAPLAGLPDADENHPWLNKILRVAYRQLSCIYHFQSLEFFKSKFKPSYWEANYLYAYPRGINLTLVKHLLEAFLGESLLVIVEHKFSRLGFHNKKNVVSNLDRHQGSTRQDAC